MINDVIITFFEEKMGKSLEVKKKVVPLHPQSRNKPRIRNAQMAESVDALVSNTSGFSSIPVRPRVWVQKGESFKTFSFFVMVYPICFQIFRKFRFVEYEGLTLPFPSELHGNNSRGRYDEV